MLKRFWAWMGRHRWRIFLAVLVSPVIFLVIGLPATAVRFWYYREFPFSELAVRLFAEPGEDTLMFRYRLGDRLLYVRSDMAQPAYSIRRETEYCNPLWGECQIFPLVIRIYISSDWNQVCIDGYLSCLKLSEDRKNKVEFRIESKGLGVSDLMMEACYKNNYLFSDGDFKGYFVNKAYGETGRLCYLLQPGGVLETLLTAMETGNYERFPYIRRTDSAD